jgi:lipopolysaccharide heptosyltransferase II
MNKIVFLKSVDRVIGKALVQFLSRLKNRDSLENEFKDLKRLLIIRPGGIGDGVLLLPAIKALKRAYPEVLVDILCEKRNSGVFELTDYINQIYLYDRGLDLLKVLNNRYELVIDTEQWHRLSAVVASLTGSPVRIGFDTNERGRLFTHRIPYSHDDYEVYSFFHLLKPLFSYIPEFNVDEPFIDIEDKESALISLPSVALFPGATIRERRWGGENYGIVARGLIEKGFNVVILGSEIDREDARKILEIAPHAIDLTGKTTLKDVALILKKCSLLICADSGLLHLAVGIGTPTLSLFGSGIEKKWAPRGKRHITLNKRLPCSPCTKFGYTPKCKKGIACLKSISPDEVLEVALRMLESKP